jgi:hypothetical protein
MQHLLAKQPVCMLIFAVPAFALFAGCAGHATARVATPPAMLELYSEARAATLHFPRGSYTLDSEDRLGFYYRSPTGVIEHTAAGARRRDGGIFVSNRNVTKLRGYVIMPYGLTHVGNLSHTSHEFHDAAVPAEGPRYAPP